MESKINFREPEFFNLGFKVYGSFRAILIIFVYILVSLLLGFIVFFLGISFGHMEILTFGSITLYFLIYSFLGSWTMPFLLGNNIIEKHFPIIDTGAVMEVIYNPRRWKGLEGFMDSGDDMGILKISDDKFIFNGDSSDFVISKGDIESIQFKNIGHRVLWLLGNGIVFKLKEPVSNISGFTLYPRVGFTLPQYWRANRKFQTNIKTLGLKITE